MLLLFLQSPLAQIYWAHTHTHTSHAAQSWEGRVPSCSSLSLCCLLKTWLKWRVESSGCRKRPELLSPSRWFNPCGNLWSVDQQTHSYILYSPVYDFRSRRRGMMHTHPPKCLFTLTEREATPLPAVTSILTHLLSLRRYKHSNGGMQSCSVLRITCTYVQKWARSRLAWKASHLSHILYFLS